MTNDDPRLPTHVVPSHYQLELEPDLASATFEGSATIDINILEATDEIVCNAAELEIKSASIVYADGNQLTPDVWLDEKAERLHLTVTPSLPAGAARIELTFSGILNDQLRGFYRSTYKDDDGAEHTIATTQFQSTDARRAFPCWDEPAYKATFTTTLVVAEEHLAISNTTATKESLSNDGRRRITFAKTIPMSTYLVAFVVGPLELSNPIDVDGVTVRVVHRPGQSHLTSFALDVAAHALRWFTEYYAIPYPSDKIDLVAIPDFASGAMENLGCITFREVLLLIDPHKATQAELENAAAVINHELAHMWFGDLVTMKWWEGIWLNEAFATFMEISCSDAYRPDWQMWTTFCRSRAAAFATDALNATRPIEYPVVTPAEADGMFDILTYEKGAAVLRMLEQHLGADVFRAGVRHYLSTHAYANTNTGDLWDSLEAASGENVRDIMEAWIYQRGYPLVELADTAHGLVVSQRRFTLASTNADDPTASASRPWAVPLSARSHNRELRLRLDSPALTLSGCSADDFVTFNAGAYGFFRVSPSARTVGAAVSGELTPSERHAVIDDLWALTVAGETSAQEFFEIAVRFFDETDLTVWQALARSLTHLRQLVDKHFVVDQVTASESLSADNFTSAVAALANGALERIGVEPRPNDDDRTRQLRATLVTLLGTVADDREIIAMSPQLRTHDDTTLATAALGVVAHNGGRSQFDEIRAASQQATDPQTEQRNLRVLADFRDTMLIDEMLEAIKAGEVRTQDGPYWIRRALTNQAVGGHVWDFVASHWKLLTSRFPSNSTARMLEGIVMLDTSDQVAKVSEFLAAHPVPQASKQVTQHLERQRINAAFRLRVQKAGYDFAVNPQGSDVSV